MTRPTSALIVDDEEHARLYIRLLLKEVGIVLCWEAKDAEEALAVFEKRQPGLVVLDVNLRLVTGLQVLQEIKKQKPDQPVMMLSSESALKTVHEAVRLGALGYILKHSGKETALKTLKDALSTLDPVPKPEGEASK